MRTYYLCLSLFILLVGCNEPLAEVKQVIRPIAWLQVAGESSEQVRRLSGTLQPVEEANLSFQVGGRTESVKVKLGDTVKAGDVLAQLEQRSYLLGQQSSQANLQQAKATLSKAENEFHRYTELLAKKLVSQSAYEQTKAAFESAVSSVDLAKTQLAISEKDLQDTTLVAPYSGRITKRLIEPSMQVVPGQASFEIEGDNGLEVKIMMPETLLKNIVKNSKVNIHYPAFAQQKSIGVITEIGTRAETANAFPVTVLITKPFSQLRAGMTAAVDFAFSGGGITEHRGQTFRVPLTALGSKKGQETFVYVFDTETKIINKRLVQIENISSNDVLISSGLTNGEIIAIAGVYFLRDKQSVVLFEQQVKTFN